MCHVTGDLCGRGAAGKASTTRLMWERGHSFVDTDTDAVEPRGPVPGVATLGHQMGTALCSHHEIQIVARSRPSLGALPAYTAAWSRRTGCGPKV